MKMVKRIIAIILICSCLFSILSPVYAASDILNTIFNKGGGFFKNNVNNSDAKNTANLFTKELTASGGMIDTIKTVGYLVFFISGALLGIKYMISGVEGKTFAKQGLISYCLGAAFFYLADQIFTFIYGIFKTDISSATSFASIQGKIWATFTVIVNVALVTIIVVYGLKYMWSSAQDRSKLKQGMIPVLIGAVLIMCTLQILKYIVAITTNTIGNNTTYNVSYVEIEDIPRIESL